MTVAEQLIAAKNLIQNPKNWIKGNFRVGDAYCASGALIEVIGMDNHRYHIETETAAYQTLNDVIPEAQVPAFLHKVNAFNDSSTHEEVLEAFDRAIALAVSRGI